MHKSKTLVAALAVVFALGSPLAFAGKAEEIAAINENILVLQARLKQLEVEDQIAKKEAETAATMRTHRSAENGPDDNAGPTPVVRSIEGYGGAMSAVLAFGGGETVIARKGGTLPGGWSVVEIAPDSVILKRKGKLVYLKFGFSPSAGQPAVAQQGQPGFGPVGMGVGMGMGMMSAGNMPSPPPANVTPMPSQMQPGGRPQ